MKRERFKGACRLLSDDKLTIDNPDSYREQLTMFGLTVTSI
jgi:hypothetical protein